MHITEENRDFAQEFAVDLVKSLRFETVEDLADDVAWGGVGQIKNLYMRAG